MFSSCLGILVVDIVSLPVIIKFVVLLFATALICSISGICKLDQIDDAAKIGIENPFVDPDSVGISHTGNPVADQTGFL